MEEKNFELEIAPLTDEELDAVDGGAGESRSAWRSANTADSAKSTQSTKKPSKGI